MYRPRKHAAGDREREQRRAEPPSAACACSHAPFICVRDDHLPDLGFCPVALDRVVSHPRRDRVPSEPAGCPAPWAGRRANASMPSLSSPAGRGLYVTRDPCASYGKLSFSIPLLPA